MINDVFDNVGPGIGCALYVDDGAIWKRVQNFLQVISCMPLKRWNSGLWTGDLKCQQVNHVEYYTPIIQGFRGALKSIKCH